MLYYPVISVKYFDAHCKVPRKPEYLYGKINRMQTGTVLIVDDNKSVLTSLELLLEDEFERVETASNPNSILSVLDTMPVDLVILDMNFSAGVNTGNEGLFCYAVSRK